MMRSARSTACVPPGPYCGVAGPTTGASSALCAGGVSPVAQHKALQSRDLKASCCLGTFAPNLICRARSIAAHTRYTYSDLSTLIHWQKCSPFHVSNLTPWPLRIQQASLLLASLQQQHPPASFLPQAVSRFFLCPSPYFLSPATPASSEPALATAAGAAAARASRARSACRRSKIGCQYTMSS